MSDQVDYTDGNYVSLSIEELPYERADENDYHLKLDSMGLKGNDEFPLEDAVPLLVPLVASIPKTKRRRVKKTKELVKKKSKKNKKTRGTSKLVVKPRTLVTKSGELLRANLSRR
jgi:hypothetical protein